MQTITPRQAPTQPGTTSSRKSWAREPKVHSPSIPFKSDDYTTRVRALLKRLGDDSASRKNAKWPGLIKKKRTCHPHLDLITILQGTGVSNASKARAITLLLDWDLHHLELFDWDSKSYRNYLSSGFWINNIQSHLSPCLQRFTVELLLLNGSACVDNEELTERYLWFLRKVAEQWFVAEDLLGRQIQIRIREIIKRYPDLK